MLIVKTPLRVPFFSGGSDHPAFLQYEDGMAFSATIDKYVYVIIHSNVENQFRFTHDTIQVGHDVTQIKHTITEKSFEAINFRIGEYNRLNRTELKALPKNSLTIASLNDINQVGTGLGASSAYTVGLVNALYTFCSFPPNETTLDKMAEMACKIEIDYCKYPIGVQDQWAASIGGTNLFTFNKDGTVDMEQFHNMERMRRFANSLILINSGVQRHYKNIVEKGKETKGYLTHPKYENLTEAQKANMREGKTLAKTAWDILNSREGNGNLDYIGEMLNNSWRKKKLTDRKVTGEQIDDLYDLCIDNGAIGGKLLGSGGGGYMLFYVPHDKRDEFLTKLPYEYQSRVVNFSFTHEGSKIIYDDRSTK